MRQSYKYRGDGLMDTPESVSHVWIGFESNITLNPYYTFNLKCTISLCFTNTSGTICISSLMTEFSSKASLSITPGFERHKKLVVRKYFMVFLRKYE